MTPRSSLGNGEEQVIWRLRSRAVEGKIETGNSTGVKKSAKSSNGTQTPVHSPSRRMLSGMESSINNWKEQSDKKLLKKENLSSHNPRRTTADMKNIISTLPNDLRSQSKMLADLAAPMNKHTAKSKEEVLKRNEVVSFTAG